MTVDPIGEVWSHALALARALVGRGSAVALACMGAPLTLAQRAEVAAISGVELFTSGFKLEWMEDPWGDVDAAGEWLLDLAELWQPELVQLNGLVHAALPWNRPVVVKAHSCVLSWWKAVRGEPIPPRLREYRRRVTAGLDAAQWIVAPTRAMLDTLYEQYGQTGLQSVIFDGAEPPQLSELERQHVVLGVGRLWDRAKNVEMLAAIAKDLPWPVALAGDARAPEGGRPPAFSRVDLLGRLDAPELARRYATAGIFALPALYEPFGRSALQAAQHGCPLVLADIPSLRELWDGAAIFVDPRDAATWRRVLRLLIGDAARRVELGSAARARSQRYTDEAMVQRYVSVYDYLTLPKGARPLA